MTQLERVEGRRSYHLTSYPPLQLIPYPFSSFCNALKKRQSVPSAMIQ